LEAVIGRQQIQSLELAPGEYESGEVNCAQGSQHSTMGDVARHLTDAAGDFPQFAPGPDRGDISLGIGEPVLPGDTKGAQPDERPARLPERKSRRHKDAR